MHLVQFHKLILFVFILDPFEVEDFSEIGVGKISNVDEVGLDQSLRGLWVYLESLQEWLDLQDKMLDAASKRRGCGRKDGQHGVTNCI